MKERESIGFRDRFLQRCYQTTGIWNALIRRYHSLTRIFHVCEAFICPDSGISASLQQGIKGAAVVDYCNPLITRQMGVSGTPVG